MSTIDEPHTPTEEELIDLFTEPITVIPTPAPVVDWALRVAQQVDMPASVLGGIWKGDPDAVLAFGALCVRAGYNYGIGQVAA